MIVLAALLASQLAPGCRRLERSILCELAPAIRVSPPPPPPVVATRNDAAGTKTAPHHHRRPIVRASPEAAPPPSTAEVERRVQALIEIGDCTGARILLTFARDAAVADRTYRTCIGLPAAPSGQDLGAVPGEAAPARVGIETVEHPQ